MFIVADLVSLRKTKGKASFSMCGTRFWDDDELKAATEALSGDETDDGTDCLKEKLAKCIERGGGWANI